MLSTEKISLAWPAKIILSCSLALIALVHCAGCIYFKGHPCPVEELSDGRGLLGSWRVVKLADPHGPAEILHIGPSLNMIDANQAKNAPMDSAGHLRFIFVGPLDDESPIGMVAGEAGTFEVDGVNYLQCRITTGGTQDDDFSSSGSSEFGLFRYTYNKISKDKINVWTPDAVQIAASSGTGRLESLQGADGLMQFTAIDIRNEPLQKKLRKFGPGLIFGKFPTHELHRIVSK